MAAETKTPDGLLTSTNLTGGLSAINVDDTTWLVATANNVDSVCIVSFPTPTGSPTVGAGLQNFTVKYRVTANASSVTFNAYLRESGVRINGGAAIDTWASTSTAEVTRNITWNASLLGTANGSAVELEVYAVAVTGAPGVRTTGEFQFIDWDVDYSAGVTITPIADAFTLADQTLLIQQARDISLTEDSLTLSDGALSVSQFSQATRFGLSGGIWSPYDQSVFANKTANGSIVVSLIADSFALSAQTLQIQQSVNIDIVSDSFTLTDGALSISQGANVVISLSADSFTLSDQTLLIQQDQNISLSADSLVLTDQTLQIQQDKNISLEADTFTLNDGLILIQQAKNIDLLAESFTLNGGTLGIAVGSNVVVSLTPDSFTLSDQVLQIRQDQNISLVSDSFTLSDQTLQIQQAVNVDIVADSFTLSDGTLSISQGSSTFITLSADSFTLTESTLTINVETETRITPIADVFTLTDQTLFIQQAVNINLLADSLTLTGATVSVVWLGAETILSTQGIEMKLYNNAIEMSLYNDTITMSN